MRTLRRAAAGRSSGTHTRTTRAQQQRAAAAARLASALQVPRKRLPNALQKPCKSLACMGVRPLRWRKGSTSGTRRSKKSKTRSRVCCLKMATKNAVWPAICTHGGSQAGGAGMGGRLEGCMPRGAAVSYNGTCECRLHISSYPASCVLGMPPLPPTAAPRSPKSGMTTPPLQQLTEQTKLSVHPKMAAELSP